MCPPNRAFSERLAGVQRAAPRGLARRRHRKPSVVAPPPVVVTLHQSWGGGDGPSGPWSLWYFQEDATCPRCGHCQRRLLGCFV